MGFIIFLLNEDLLLSPYLKPFLVKFHECIKDICIHSQSLSYCNKRHVVCNSIVDFSELDCDSL